MGIPRESPRGAAPDGYRRLSDLAYEGPGRRPTRPPTRSRRVSRSPKGRQLDRRRPARQGAQGAEGQEAHQVLCRRPDIRPDNDRWRVAGRRAATRGRIGGSADGRRRDARRHRRRAPRRHLVRPGARAHRARRDRRGGAGRRHASVTGIPKRNRRLLVAPDHRRHRRTHFPTPSASGRELGPRPGRHGPATRNTSEIRRVDFPGSAHRGRPAQEAAIVEVYGQTRLGDIKIDHQVGDGTDVRITRTLTWPDRLPRRPGGHDRTARLRARASAMWRCAVALDVPDRRDRRGGHRRPTGWHCWPRTLFVGIRVRYLTDPTPRSGGLLAQTHPRRRELGIAGFYEHPGQGDPEAVTRGLICRTSRAYVRSLAVVVSGAARGARSTTSHAIRARVHRAGPDRPGVVGPSRRRTAGPRYLPRGATLDSVEGDTAVGRMRIGVSPLQITYRGTCAESATLSTRTPPARPVHRKEQRRQQHGRDDRGRPPAGTT